MLHMLCLALLGARSELDYYSKVSFAVALQSVLSTTMCVHVHVHVRAISADATSATSQCTLLSRQVRRQGMRHKHNVPLVACSTAPVSCSEHTHTHTHTLNNTPCDACDTGTGYSWHRPQGYARQPEC